MRKLKDDGDDDEVDGPQPAEVVRQVLHDVVTVSKKDIILIDKVFDFEHKMHCLVRYSFPSLTEGRMKEEDDEIREITVLNDGNDHYRIPTIFVYQLLLFSFIVLALSTQVFISSYLFIKSYGCSTEPYVHCFEAKVHFLVIGMEELDCTDSRTIENITSIICYDLTLNIKNAVLDGGTIIAWGAVYFAFIKWVLLTLVYMKCWRKCTEKSKIWGHFRDTTVHYAHSLLHS